MPAALTTGSDNGRGRGAGPPERVDVLVVGAGPTGTTLATILARAGVRSQVIDAATGDRHESSRATTLHALTLFHLDGLDGAGRELTARGAVAPASNLWRGRTLLAEAFWHRLPGPHRAMVNIPQSVTEQVLRSRLRDAGSRVRWGWTCEDVTPGQATATARLRHADGRRRTVSADWVIGCDGAHSRVRSCVDVSLAGTTHRERFLLADVRLDTDLDPTRTHLFVSTAGLMGIMPMPGGGFRLNGTLGDHDTTEPAVIADLLSARLGAAADRARMKDVT